MGDKYSFPSKIFTRKDMQYSRKICRGQCSTYILEPIRKVE